MSDTSTAPGKVVVNRAMSLDGFIAGPGHAMDWIFDFMRSEEAFPEVMAAHRRHAHRPEHLRGREADGRRGHRLRRGSRVRPHKPPDEPDSSVPFLTCDIEEAVATALSAAGGKNLEILGADVAGQCLQRGSSTRSSCTSCRCCSATASASRPRASQGSISNRSATRSMAPSRCFDSASASSPAL
jgi:hypothetical protein